jgi:hypothetical protein
MAVGGYKFVKEHQEIFKAQLDVCEAAQKRACAVFFYGNMRENPVLGRYLLE